MQPIIELFQQKTVWDRKPVTRPKPSFFRLPTIRSKMLVALLILISPVAASGQSFDPSAPLLITAQELHHDLEAETVTARGKVEISNDERRLLADKVTYNQRTGQVAASGNIVLLEGSGDAFFADELILDETLASGFAGGLGVLFSDQSRIASAQAVRREGRYTELEDAVYSPCVTCRERGDDPAWQIRASRVIHDQAEQTVTYQHARLEIYGVPVAYLPYFSHPDPSVERKSGFLAPSAGSDSVLGLTLETPYHFVIADNRDVTLTPLFTTKGGVVLGGEFRDLQEVGRTEGEVSLTFTDAYQRQENDDSSNEARGHIEARGAYKLGDAWDAGFNLALASDNSYLQRYDFSNDDVLENRLFAEKLDGRNYILADAYAFQGLRDFDEQGRIPVALPWIRAGWIIDDLPRDSELTINADALALTRSTGLDTRRLSTEAVWSTDMVGSTGDLWSVSAGLRGDFYQIDGDPVTLGEGSSQTVGRLLPRASVDWSWPLAAKKGEWLHVIEPLVSATATVDDGNDSDIPNEDSIDFELDDTNLFEPDRFTGRDLYDGGTKVTFGGRFDSISDQGFKIGGLVGQSYRIRGDSAFSAGSGVDSKFSDYVGRLNIEPNEFVNASYRFRIDHENLDFRRSDLRLLFGPERARFNVGYLNLSEEVDLETPTGREELSAGVRLRITERLAVGLQSRIDLTNNEPVAHMFGLVYTDDCFVITTGVERRFTSRGELEDNTRFAFRIGLRNLGEVKTDSDVLEN